MISKNKYYLALIALIYCALGCHAQPMEKGFESYLEDLKVLSHDSLEGRKTGTAGIAKARSYIIQQFARHGLKPIGEDYQSTFEYTPKNSDEVREGINIIGIHPGKTEEQIVITAHYDHEGVKNGAIYNGADDNASGVVALFALADYFKDVETNHTLVFIAFDAEEVGLQGARAYVDQQKDHLKNIRLNINFDMISHNDDNELVAAGTFHYPFLREILEQIDTGEMTLKFGHDDPALKKDDWTFSSDHGPFHAAGIPFIYFGVEDHKDYHRPTDTYESINHQFYLQVLDFLTHAVNVFDSKL